MSPAHGSPAMAPWLERAWLDRYLDRQLTADEVAWFEAYVLDKPALLDQIETDIQLRDAFATAAGGRESGAPAPASTSATAPAAAAAPARPPARARALPALAAGLVAGLGLAWLASDFRLGDRGLVANPPRILFDTLRGASAEPRLEAGDPDSPIVLVELPVPPGSNRVSAVIETGGRRRELSALAVSPDGFVLIAVPRGAPGLAIELRFQRANGSAGSVRYTLPSGA